ncbi:hypothetical protein GCM10023068_42220 [Leifsonia shinshuensis]
MRGRAVNFRAIYQVAMPAAKVSVIVRRMVMAAMAKLLGRWFRSNAIPHLGMPSSALASTKIAGL